MTTRFLSNFDLCKIYKIKLYELKRSFKCQKRPALGWDGELFILVYYD